MPLISKNERNTIAYRSLYFTLIYTTSHCMSHHTTPHHTKLHCTTLNYNSTTHISYILNQLLVQRLSGWVRWGNYQSIVIFRNKHLNKPYSRNLHLVVTMFLVRTSILRCSSINFSSFCSRNCCSSSTTFPCPAICSVNKITNYSSILIIITKQ